MPKPAPIGLTAECARCEKQLTEPGALLFSTPRQRKGCVPTTTKRHLCGECYSDVVGFIARGVASREPTDG